MRLSLFTFSAAAAMSGIQLSQRSTLRKSRYLEVEAELVIAAATARRIKIREQEQHDHSIFFYDEESSPPRPLVSCFLRAVAPV